MKNKNSKTIFQESVLKKMKDQGTFVLKQFDIGWPFFEERGM
jgi:hypothetical protein